VTPVLGRTADLPGVNWQILSVTGGNGPGGAPQAGDFLSVDFRITRDDQSPISPAEMNTARIYISGPTTNYQVVIGRLDDVRARAVQNPNGTWRYTYGVPIPDVYEPPPNDSPSYGPGDGEMAGQPLVSGTYTVGMEGYKIYSIGGVDYRDTGNATLDFLFGSATMLEPREVVKIDNCNRCHAELRAHGGIRREVKNCILCHVSGSEDKNDPGTLGGSPGASVDFRVMIHKIHMGEHLPSVNGVGTNTDGTRNYDATPTPYQLVGNNNSIHDFSHVPFPVWPNLDYPMPRDDGYTGLTSSQKAQEDEIRRGVTRCEKCHGDPDGAGPITAPAQGNNAFTEPTRRACGSCHDDVDWSKPYRANLLEMPPQTDDQSCAFCHGSQGTLSPTDAHVHPINDPSVNPGIHFVITALTDAGMNNGDGKIQPGEKVSVTFHMEDDAGNPVTVPSWQGMSGSVSLAIAGPTTNRNILLNGSLPLGALPGSGPYTTNVPEVILLDYVGDATAGADVFTTSRAPHWPTTTTSVSAAVPNGSMATTSAAAHASQNYLDLVPGFNTMGSGGFARDRFVVIDNGVMGKEEYLKIQFVDGNRIWFGSLASVSASAQYQPGTRTSHNAGATVQVVQIVPKSAPADYTLNASLGQITEAMDLGTGNGVLVTYTSDFVMPAVYPVSINDGSLDQDNGEWAGLPIESGTYTIGFWASRTFTYSAFNESNSYRNTSVNDSAHWNFLVGNATTLMPETIISSKDNCNACHDTVYAHGGGREGYNTCILCHGTAGGEDRPRYVAANAPATTGLSIDFRSMLHKIHMGESLSFASTWKVIGFSSAGYPNNFSENFYSEVVFPAMPDGVKNCEKCHGAGNPSWKVPTDRTHPSQTVPTQSWRHVCGSCHDASAAQAHIQSQTAPNGAEACSICHGPGEAEDVAIKHKIR
jgi:OmcA/MtrC family decaheme c-type cytochrome